MPNINDSGAPVKVPTQANQVGHELDHAVPSQPTPDTDDTRNSPASNVRQRGRNMCVSTGQGGGDLT